MYFSVFLSLVLSVSVHCSGYFPSIGGPWSKYTTTTPAPQGVGVNLPVTEAPPPASVTFVPRPRPIPQHPTNAGNNVDSFPYQSEESNSPLLQNHFIVTDPMTGEQFLVPKQSFWDRYRNRGVNVNQRGTAGRPQNRYGEDQEGYNWEPSQLSRTRRSVNNGESMEGSHTATFGDNIGKDESPENLEKTFNVSPTYRDKATNLNSNEIAPDSSASGEDNSYDFKSSTDIFKLFFPTAKLNQDKRMIYTYSLYRISPVADHPTTTIRIPTPTTTTTPQPSAVVNETSDTTTNASEDIPQTTGFPETDYTHHEDVTPIASR